MNRAQLEHLIRAAGAVTGSRRLIVLGSQAILGQHPDDAPARAILSREADLIPMDCPEATDKITGALGELSTFDETFGYHADGVDSDTATLPLGWEDRLVEISTPGTNGYIGLCLDTHDLVLAKYYAGRKKDHEFCSAIVEAGLVDRAVLLERLASMEIDAPHRLRMTDRISSDYTNRNRRGE